MAAIFRILSGSLLLMAITMAGVADDRQSSRIETVDSPDALARIEALHELAVSGDAAAQYALAWAYRTGTFLEADDRDDSRPPMRISPDPHRAMGWLVQAANAGHVEAHALVTTWARANNMSWKPSPLPDDLRPVPQPRLRATKPSAAASQTAMRPKPSSEAAEPHWMVRVGVFGQEANADKLVRTLKEQGWTDVGKTLLPEKALFAVQVGPMTDVVQAMAARRKIAKANDLEPILVEIKN